MCSAPDAGYVELHAHSCFSLLDGASFPDELVATAVELGLPALALTDHDNLHAALDFANIANAAGLQPITGAELTLIDGTHLTLLVESVAGYRNLCRLITTAHYTGERTVPAVPIEALAEHHEGLILLTGCRQSELCRRVDADDLGAGEQPATAVHDQGSQGATDPDVVDDAGRLHPERRHAGHVRFEFLGLAESDSPDRYAIGLAALVQLLQRRELLRTGGHHELAADLHRDAVFDREVPHRSGAGRAQPSLETPRCVVEPGVDHARIAPGLVPGDLCFLLQHRDVMPAAGQFVRGRQPYDARSRDDDLGHDHSLISSLHRAHDPGRTCTTPQPRVVAHDDCVGDRGNVRNWIGVRPGIGCARRRSRPRGTRPGSPGSGR